MYLIKSNVISIFEKPEAELNLKLNQENVTLGESFSVFIFYKTKTLDISSFDAVVAYDPESIRVDEIKTSDVFPQYPRKLIEDFKSRFVVTGVQTNLKNKLKASNGELAEIAVTALKPGNTKLNFVIDGQKFTNMANSKMQDVHLKTNVLDVEIKE